MKKWLEDASLTPAVLLAEAFAFFIKDCAFFLKTKLSCAGSALITNPRAMNKVITSGRR